MFQHARRITLLAGLFLVCATPAAALEYPIWHSPRDLGPISSGIEVAHGNPSTSSDISFTSTGSKWIQMSLTLPSTVTVKGVELCYQVSDAATPLSQIRITEMTTPDAASVRMDDPTDRTSTTPECVVSSATINFDGTLTLVLLIDVANTDHTVEIGGVGIIVDDGAGSAPEALTPSD